MEKNIYQMLNDVETDFTGYEKTELTHEEMEHLKTEVLQEVAHMKNKKETRNKFCQIKTAAAACAAAVLVIGGGTVLAKGVFSDTIEKLIGSAQGTKYEQEDVAHYVKVGENAKPIEVSKEKNDYMTSTEDGGLTISVSDTYCDGYNLYFTSTLTGNKELLNDADWLGLDVTKEAAKGMSFTVNGKEMWYGPEVFRKSSENTYVMMGSVELFKEQENLKNGNTLIVECRGNRIIGKDDDAQVLNKETGESEYATVMDVAGDWHLKFPVTVDTSSNQNFAIDKEENGIVLKDATRTPTGLVVKAVLPDMTKAPYNDPYNDPYIGIEDEQGNTIQWLSGFSNYESENGEGASEQTIIVLYSGEKTLHLKVKNKNVDNGVIADIPFAVPTE